MSDWTKEQYDEQGDLWEAWYKNAIPAFIGTEAEVDEFINSKS